MISTTEDTEKDDRKIVQTPAGVITYFGLSNSRSSLWPLWLIVRSRHGQLTLAQILDPIAQLRCLFKLKPFCVLTHFKLKALDCLFDLLGAVAFDIIQFQGHFEIISF